MLLMIECYTLQPAMSLWGFKHLLDPGTVQKLGFQGRVIIEMKGVLDGSLYWIWRGRIHENKMRNTKSTFLTMGPSIIYGPFYIHII